MTPTATLPLQMAPPTVSSEIVTARVLRRSLLPTFELGVVARELAELARHQRAPLNHAMARIDRAGMQRPSAVIERAQLALLAALDVIEDGTARPTAA